MIEQLRQGVQLQFLIPSLYLTFIYMQIDHSFKSKLLILDYKTDQMFFFFFLKKKNCKSLTCEVINAGCNFM